MPGFAAPIPWLRNFLPHFSFFSFFIQGVGEGMEARDQVERGTPADLPEAILSIGLTDGLAVMSDGRNHPLFSQWFH